MSALPTAQEINPASPLNALTYFLSKARCKSKAHKGPSQWIDCQCPFRSIKIRVSQMGGTSEILPLPTLLDRPISKKASISQFPSEGQPDKRRDSQRKANYCRRKDIPREMHPRNGAQHRKKQGNKPSRNSCGRTDIPKRHRQNHR